MKKGSSFFRYCKENGVNMLIALVITLVVFVLLSRANHVLSLPGWVGVGLLCWAGQNLWRYAKWQRSEDKDRED